MIEKIDVFIFVSIFIILLTGILAFSGKAKPVYYWAKNSDGGTLDCPIKGENSWYYCEWK